MEVAQGWRDPKDTETNNIYTREIPGGKEVTRVIPDCGHTYFLRPRQTPRGRLCPDCQRKSNREQQLHTKPEVARR